jgi:alpha 1,6-mannosyltransferase
MITFRRAITIAAFILTFFYLLRSSHSKHSEKVAVSQQDPPLGVKTQKSPTTLSSQQKGYSTDTPRASQVADAPVYDPNTRKTSQQTLEDIKGKPLREQLAYQFPYDVVRKFPAYVWQTWKTTPASGNFEEKFRPAEASWTEKHPGFVHEVVTDEVAVHLLRHLYAAVPDVLEAYRAMPMAVLKADFFRYLILLARGGIYSDIDTFALKSALEWIPEAFPQTSVGLVIGIEADPDRPDWKEWYSRRIQFCQWTIEAKPGHPVLREIVASITEETLKRKRAGKLKSDQHGVIEFTGPALWTDKIMAYFNDPRFFDMTNSKGEINWRNFTGMKEPKRVGDVVVLPITSFSPGIQHSGAGEPDDPMAYVKHEFEGTWKPESERHIGA